MTQHSSESMPRDFCDVSALIPDALLDIRYAGTHNFVGEPIDGYFAPQAILTRPAAQALCHAAADFRAMGYRILIYDAYRPQRAVDHFVRWAQTDDARMKAEFYPTLSKNELFPRGYIAARSGHSRGSTVDLTLVDGDGTPLDMGGAFDFFGPVSGHDAPGLTSLQRENRALLRRIMLAHGFTDYSEEWWHYRLANEPYPDTYFDFPIVMP